MGLSMDTASFVAARANVVLLVTLRGKNGREVPDT